MYLGRRVQSSTSSLVPVGAFRAGASAPLFAAADLPAAIARFREPVHVVRDGAAGRLGLCFGGELLPAAQLGAPGTIPLLATLPGLHPEWLGDRSFAEVHGVRFPYVVGEMANGIATTRMVIAAARAGMLGFFGAAGLGFERVEKSVDELGRELGASLPWGVNLIHSPNEQALEDRVADLLIRRGVTRISASAFMALTPAVVRCAASGLTVDASGKIVRPRQVFAKISRGEVARRFMAPAPAEMLRALVDRGLLTRAEAELAAKVPVAEDITVEADSGGHTDNQALTALLPTILSLRDEMAAKHGFIQVEKKWQRLPLTQDPKEKDAMFAASYKASHPEVAHRVRIKDGKVFIQEADQVRACLNYTKKWRPRPSHLFSHN